MPIFEYRCRECGTTFEQIVRSNGDNPVTCRKCESSRVDKLLSTFAVAGASLKTSSPEPGPCGACGAPRRGMCGE
ncbi:MAG TPA: zinc ribbon domain-containing protein [Terriglobia bacterium]|nr:zinc ribbon domain-containing protein [Terriglobia bacterium]